MKVHSILLATDFSEEALPALKMGAGIARKTGARIHLFTAIPLMPPDSLPYYDMSPAATFDAEAAQTKAEEHLDREIERLGIADLKVSKAAVPAVRVATAIVNYAEEEQIDLICIGTHGRSGFRRWILGSVAEEVVRTAPCSVITSCPESPDFDLESPKVVAAIDLTAKSHQVLAGANTFARDFGAEIHVVHAVPDPIALADYQIAMEPPRTVEMLNAAETAMKEMVEQHLPNVLEGAASVKALSGKPHTAIADYVEAQSADLVIVATRGLTGLAHLLVGSTADRIVRTSKVPVLALLGTD